MRNVITVEDWVNSFQMKRKAETEGEELNGQPEKHFFPRLIDLQKMLVEGKTGPDAQVSPLINAVSGRAEWPVEEARPLNNYGTLMTDRVSVIGKGKVQFIPFVDGYDVVSGYIIRAGDPATGKVLCSPDGTPFIRSSP